MKSKGRALTLPQAAKYLGFKKGYMYKLMSLGKLPYSKPNNKTAYFDRDALDTWMLSRPKVKAKK